MASSDRWNTTWHCAGIECGLVCSVTAVSAQEGRWERVTAAGIQAFEQGDYAAAVRQFQAALPLADAGIRAGLPRLLQRDEARLTLCPRGRGARPPDTIHCLQVLGVEADLR